MHPHIEGVFLLPKYRKKADISALNCSINIKRSPSFQEEVAQDIC